MKTVKELRDFEITYKVNSLGDPLQEMNLEGELYKKYSQVDSISNFLNYLVEHENGEHYVVCCLEISSDNNGSIAIMKDIADEINHLTEFDVYCSEYYGFDDNHEIAIVVPLNISEEKIRENFKKINHYV